VCLVQQVHQHLPQGCPARGRDEGLAALDGDEGHVPASSATRFDAEFTRQCLERGRIEDTEVLKNFLKDTGQDLIALLRKGWLGVFITRMAI